MLLWILIAVLTGAAVMAVLLPLGRNPRTAGSGQEAQRVYLQQLRELEQDRAQGRINESEAESARAEIARRLIVTPADPISTTTSPPGRSALRATAAGSILGVPLLSLGLYLALGAPQMAGQPLVPRMAGPGAPSDIEALVAKVEIHLAQAPEDGSGWDVIAPVYLRLGRAAEAERAFRNAIRLAGSNVARQTGLGEAIVAGQGGVVTAEARSAFEAANEADPAAPAARFFLALAAEQEGDTDEAADGWRALLAEAPADAPWRQAIVDSLSRVDAAAAPGPDAAQMAEAEAMGPADRIAMIEGMVSGLAEKLKSDPNNVEGWLRLIRSYSVLGRPDAAAEAARGALESVQEPGGRERVKALIADLGLPNAGPGLP